MSEQCDRSADLFCLGNKLLRAVLNAESVTVSKKDLDLARVVNVAVGSKGTEIAVARNVKYKLFGIDYPQLVDIAFAVAEKDKGIYFGVALDDLSRGGKITVSIGKNN